MVSYIYVDRSGHKVARPVKNREEYFALRNAEPNVKNFAAARQGDKEAKKQLVQFNYNDLLPDGVLKGCCHPCMTYAHDIDCGCEDECRRIAQKLMEESSAIGLLELSVSSGWGLHAVCRRELGKTILENQVRLSVLTQTEMDTSAHDLARVMFTGPATEDVLLFLDDNIFVEPLTVAESEEEYHRLYERQQNGEEEVPKGANKANKHYRPWEDGDCTANADTTTHADAAESKEGGASGCTPCSKQFKGIAYSDIIAEWWNRNGGEPQEGERNVKLYHLAANLRTICDNDKTLLMEVMPRFGLGEQEFRSIVESACKEQPKGITRSLQDIIDYLQRSGRDNCPATQKSSREDQNRWLEYWGNQIAELFEPFPILRDVCKGLKRSQYPAALIVGGGFMMTLMTRCWYRFYHRPEEQRRLNNLTLIIGDPACGKSFATRLYKLLAAPIIEVSKAGSNAVNNYREVANSKGANKDKPMKPKQIIRVHPARTSVAQFIEDMVNAVEVIDGEETHLHMLMFDSELDNTLREQKKSYSDMRALELKAFHNEEDGQAYANISSIVGEFNVYWNYVFTGTPLALNQKVNDNNFNTGLSTRLTCIPMPSTNYEMIERETTVDYESDQRLMDWAYKLDKTKGELPVQKIVDELYEWAKRRMDEAKDNDSLSDELLLKRCPYHGLNFAVPFIVMRHWEEMRQDGGYWCCDFETDEVDWKLAELITNLQYACQRFFFGAMAERMFYRSQNGDSVDMRYKRKTYEAFARLSEVFTAKDVMQCFGLKSEGAARTRIARLTKDHLVEKVEDFKENGTTKARYKKTGVIMY